MNKHFAVWDTETGRVVKTSYRPADCELVIPDHHEVEEITHAVYSKIGINPFYRLNGKYVAVPKRPDDYSEFDYVEKAWVDGRDLEKRNLDTLLSIRAKRDALLLSSDWTQVTDSSLPDTTKAAWAVYRSKLRDMPKKYGDRTSEKNIVWPKAPT